MTLIYAEFEASGAPVSLLVLVFLCCTTRCVVCPPQPLILVYHSLPTENTSFVSEQFTQQTSYFNRVGSEAAAAKYELSDSTSLATIKQNANNGIFPLKQPS